MPRTVIRVKAEWDGEAEVWVATSDDVPGLVTEASSIEALQAKLSVMIPDLLSVTEGLEHEFPSEVPMVVMAESLLRLRAP